jgi:DnaJ family protein C protein 7
MKQQPDRQKGTEEEKEKAEATFRDINLANEILSDPEKRRRYDQGVDEQDIDDPHAQPHGHSHGGHGGMGGMDQEMLFEMFMRQQQAGRGRGGGGFHFG